MIHWLAQLLHPGQLRTPNGGYWFWSGIGSDIGEVTILGAVIGLYRHHNCHVNGCWRRGKPDPAHGFPACKHHHTKRSLLGVDPHV